MNLNRNNLLLLLEHSALKYPTIAGATDPATTIPILFELINFLLILLNEVFDLIIFFLLNLTDALGVDVPVIS